MFEWLKYDEISEMENDIADEVWNTLTVDELRQWNDYEFRRRKYAEYWRERGYE